VTEHQRLRATVLSIFTDVGRACGEDVADADREALSACRAQLASGQYRVVICGEFATGKSTLVNALVRRPDLLVEGDLVATSVVTILSWGATETATVVRAGEPDGPLSRQAVTMAQARAVSTGHGGEGVVAIELTAPIPALESGLVLVDTPGIDRLDPAHTAATYAFLAQADAVLLVAAITPPLSASQLKFFRDTVERCPVFVTALTQADRVDDPKVHADEARARLAAALHRPADALMVLPVSAHCALDGLAEYDPGREAESQLPALSAQIRHRLVGSVLLTRLGLALDQLAETLRLAIAPVRNEREALSSDHQRAATARLLEGMAERLELLESDGAGWRDRLVADVYRAAEPPRQRMAERFSTLRATLGQLAVQEVAADQWVSRVQREIVATVSRADADLREAVGHVAAQWSYRVSVTLTVAEADHLPPPVPSPGPGGVVYLTGAVFSAGAAERGASLRLPPSRPPARLAAARHGFIDALSTAADGAQVGGVIGFVVGAGNPAGAMVGGLVGGVAGHLIGWVRSGREQFRQARREWRQQRSGAVSQFLRDTLAEQARYAADGYLSVRDQAARTLAAELASQMAAEKTAITRSAARITASPGHDEGARQRRLREVEARHEVLWALDERIRTAQAHLAELREGLGRPAPPEDFPTDSDSLSDSLAGA
jgi:hypothetical protein